MTLATTLFRGSSLLSSGVSISILGDVALRNADVLGGATGVLESEE